MHTVQVLNQGDEQMIKLPREFRVSTDSLSIRKQGNSLILEPTKPTHLPTDFFASIRIDDPAFVRPPQGQMPDAPSL